MKKSKLISISALALAVTLVTAGCGTTDEKANTKQENSSATTEAIETTTEKPVPEIVVGDSAVKQNTKAESEEKETTETTAKPSEESSETEETSSEATPVVNRDEGSLNLDEACDIVNTMLKALSNNDFSTLMEVTNIGDFVRMQDSDIKRPRTDEEIITALEYGGFDMTSVEFFMGTAKDELDNTDAKDYYTTMEYLSSDELKELNDFASDDTVFVDANFVPHYTDCMYIAPEITDEQLAEIQTLNLDERSLDLLLSFTKMYFVKDSQDDWKIDLALNYAKVLYRSFDGDFSNASDAFNIFTSIPEE